MSQAKLEAIAKQIQQCTACGLHRSRTHAVAGGGNPNADLMFVGEAPGYYEDKHGEPFGGVSGRYLNELLAMIHLTRDDIFLSNIVRCRPPRNRDPLRSELQACRSYLNRQIEIVQPKLVVTLGRISMGVFFPNAKIAQIHGQIRTLDGQLFYPLHQPTTVLRSPALKAIMESDFKKLETLLEEYEQYVEEEPPKEDPPPMPPQQLSLFE